MKKESNRSTLPARGLTISTGRKWPSFYRNVFFPGIFLAAAIFAANFVFGAENSEKKVRTDENLVVVLTDIHQGLTLPKGRPAISGEALKKEENLRLACEKIAAMNPRPVHVLILGDIAYLDGAMADYQVAKESLDLLDKAEIPWTATLGNHDRMENFFTVFPEKKLENEPVPGKLVRVVETPKADFILYDAHQESVTPIEKENPGDGQIDDAQRAWLTKKVEEYNESKKPFYVGGHHPVFEKNVALGETLAKGESFVGALFGHWHQRFARVESDGISTACFPAIGYQFGKEPLGFTLLRLLNDGKSTLTLVTLDENDACNGDVLHFPPKEFAYVCRDGGNGGYEAFPDLCRLADGRLLSVFYDGWTHVSIPDANRPNGGRISGCYSSDEGETWSEPFVLIDTPLDDRDPSITQLADGRLLCNWFTYAPAPDGKPAHCVCCLAESTDGGKTWSEPRKIFEDVPCSSPIRVLDNGRMILPTYVQNETTHSGSVAYSDDGGKTWSENILIPNGGMTLDAETDVIQRKDGSLYALQRPVMAFSISTDRGATWSESKKVGFEGHAPYLLRLTSGEIVAAFRWVPNTCLRVSTDDGQTWGENVLVDHFVGAYPSMVQRKDGSVLIIYYEEGNGSSIRVKRFRVTDGKVQWLSL